MGERRTALEGQDSCRAGPLPTGAGAVTMENMLDFGAQAVRVAVSLGIVLSVLGAAVYGIRILGRKVRRTNPDPWIHIQAQHPLGLKHNLLLVRVQEQFFLLGLSPRGIHFLTSVQGGSKGAARSAADGAEGP